MWLPEDTDAVLEYLDVEDDRCGGCGQLRAESMDPALSMSWEAVALRCNACEAKDVARRRYEDGNASTSGLYFGVSRS